MHLVEIFLPLRDKNGKPFAADAYQALRRDLLDRFGGVTAFSRAPAEGTFKEGRKIMRDEIVIFEVMTDRLDLAWWKNYRTSLERTFEQDEILVRATPVTKL
jgi:hypothetical protein